MEWDWLVSVTPFAKQVIAMFGEKWLKTREKAGEIKGQAKRDKAWRDWYNANVKHINGASPPPPPPPVKT